VRAIERALARGFRVTTNTTLFEGADPERVARFFDAMMELGVEGMMVSPGYSYDKAPDQEHFLRRERTVGLFRGVFARRGRRRWRFNQSPLFLEFLLGARDYDCTPWGNPTYSVFGWQKPCYLLQEGYAASFRELLEETRFEDYGHRSGNPRCRDCMVHSGFEASAVADGFSSLRGFAAMARAALRGPRAPAPRPAAPPASPASPASPALPAPPARPAAGPGPARGLELPASAAALWAAFEYRGDVTLTLTDGSTAQGYVANLTESELQLWRRGETAVLRVPRTAVARVALTGRDPAAPVPAAS
jgi:hypothetical protein